MRAYTLISGSTSEVGHAVVRRLADGGALILHGRDEAKLRSLLGSCSATFEHMVWVQDLNRPDEIAGSLGALLAGGERAVEAFVHCAGVAHVLPARTAPLSAAMESFNINCISAQQIVATLLKKRVNPSPLRNVAFISSIYSRVGVRAHSLYCASKAALDGLMRALAVELAPETRVNSILPGALDTAMARNAMSDPEIVRNLQSAYPLGIGYPKDVAAAVAFLLSEDSRWITGQEIVIDGGRLVNFSLK